MCIKNMVAISLIIIGGLVETSQVTAPQRRAREEELRDVYDGNALFPHNEAAQCALYPRPQTKSIYCKQLSRHQLLRSLSDAVVRLRSLQQSSHPTELSVSLRSVESDLPLRLNRDSIHRSE